MSIEINLNKQFGIKSYTSFSDDGVYFEKLSKVNLFIGKNNCGKSNILKFLKALSVNNGAWGTFQSNPSTIHAGSGSTASMFCKFQPEELGFPLQFQNLENGVQVFRNINFAFPNGLLVELNFKDVKLTIAGPKLADDVQQRHLCAALINHFKIGGQADWRIIEHYFQTLFINAINTFSARVIYIPDFRQITKPIDKAPPSAFTSTITGQNIISEINKMKNPDLDDFANLEKFLKIENTIKELLDADELKIEIPSNVDKMILNLNGDRFALESFGTGIHEIVLLCSALILHEDCIVCLEEPEIHLHPTLQRKFINFLHQTNNQYFIATHSNVFIDESNADQSIYHIKYENHASTATLISATNDYRGLLADLGYKASDLLQTNGIIWVEGPSDRNFLKKWLALRNKDYQEGIHFSIMFYGGKLLSHLSFDDESGEELIRLFRINPNSFVIIDRDAIGGDVNSTKRRIVSEIGEDRSWITKGKEIENYLPVTALNSWLTVKGMNPLTGEFREDDEFDLVIATNNPEFQYSRRKVFYSGEICNHIYAEHFDTLDLGMRVDSVLRQIELWNK